MRRRLPCACGNPATIQDRCKRCDDLEGRGTNYGNRHVPPDVNHMRWPHDVVAVPAKGWGFLVVPRGTALNLADLRAK
jgi:hypothetical protein